MQNLQLGNHTWVPERSLALFLERIFKNKRWWTRTPSQRRRYRKELLAEFFGHLDGLNAGVKAVYLDRGFYDSKCLTLLQAHNFAYVIPL